MTATGRAGIDSAPSLWYIYGFRARHYPRNNRPGIENEQ